ncbi:MAG: hypothetical protein M3383_01670, partial [Actinomycetota bacterium]|nr:hypothetical protein [Actinomycetota bacterium]
MGIFDDAIRQHLDLKRRQGAEETELKQLEDEAFGPPARPGEPEFGETGDHAQVELADADQEPQAPPEPAVSEAEDPAAVEEATAAAGTSTFSTAEREAIADQPTTFFDHQTPEDEEALALPEADLELDVDLDLDLEEELEDAGALDEERASGPREDLAEAPLEPGPVDEEPSGTEPAGAD